GSEMCIRDSEKFAAPPQPEAPWRPPEVRLGRHATAAATPPPPRPERVVQPGPPPAPPRGRHWVPPEVPPNPAGRHRPADQAVEEPVPAQEAVETQGQHADGQSFSDLMQRLQADPPAKGGRRRRKQD
nr:hypothetical protein [Mycobacterium sp.]